MNDKQNPVEIVGGVMAGISMILLTLCWIAVPVAGGYFIVKAIFG
jgi:hypothetical protein